MAQLFKGDAYAIITTDTERIVLNSVNMSRRLAIKFNITHTSDSHPNQGSCSIFNLSEHNRNNITENAKKIDIYAGYEELKLIGTGTIQNVNNIKISNEWETQIKFGDGQNNYQTAKFSKSFSSGFELKRIITDIAKSFGLAVSDVSNIVEKIQSGLSLDGLSKDVLEELSKQVGFDWSIQDGTLKITDVGKPIDNNAIVVNAETGLLQHPEITERGVKVRVQLNPDIRPRKLIDVESISARITSEKLKDMRNKSANGVYICDTVQFMGDNFGGGFETFIDAIRYG